MNSVQSLYGQNFGNLEIALLFTLIFVSMGLSKLLKLDLEKDFLIASLRTTVQLIAVGYILRWVLKSDSLAINFLILLVMTLVAAQAVTSRLKQKNLKFYFVAFAVLFASVWPLGVLTLTVFFPFEALKHSLFFIPYMGVMMGNALSAISLTFVGLERVRRENILEIETFKALGASGLEACQRLYREVLRNALTPILNGMTIVGIVSLPGMMAGQLIGGVDPLTAARFQILVMFLILLAALCGSLLGLFANHFYFMPSWLNHQTGTWGFQIPSGSKLILSGPSGTGKSRLLKSMTGLDEESQRTSVNEKSQIKLLSDVNVKTQYLPQKAFFIPGTVEENLKTAFMFKAHRDATYPASEVLTLINDLGLKPEILASNATTLSGGEAQLIHLIRALLLNPEVLFLDEPSSSLDAGKTALLEQFLNSWVSKNHRSLVMITHNQEQMKRFASRVLLLKEGGLVYE
jgi:putative ABC transport system permease protein